MKISLNRSTRRKGGRRWYGMARLRVDRGALAEAGKGAVGKNAPAYARLSSPGTRNSWHKRKGEYDFSHSARPCPAVWRVKPVRPSVRIAPMSLRLAPRFYSFTIRCYLRPVRDHLVATVETYAPLMARARQSDL